MNSTDLGAADYKGEQRPSMARGGATETVSTAQALIQAGDFERAERLLVQLRATSDHPQILYLLGLSSYRAGRYGAALDAFNLLVQSTPGDHRALYSLAIAQEKVGDRAGAVDTLGRSLAIEPDFAPARQKRKALQARSSPDATADGRQQPQPATLAEKLDERTGTAVPTTGPIATGHRRVSSTAGIALWGVALGAVGVVIYSLNETLAARLARWSMLGRTPGFFADRLAELDATGASVGREQLVRDLDSATSTLAGRLTTFTSLLEVGAVALLVLAAVTLVGTVLVARLTRYEVYEHRIDVTRGILRRRTRALWLYELTNAVYEQPLSLLVTGNARIRVDTDSGEPATIIGYGGAGHMQRLWAELRDAALVERRTMRRWWL